MKKSDILKKIKAEALLLAGITALSGQAKVYAEETQKYTGGDIIGMETYKVIDCDYVNFRITYYKDGEKIVKETGPIKVENSNIEKIEFETVEVKTIDGLYGYVKRPAKEQEFKPLIIKTPLYTIEQIPVRDMIKCPIREIEKQNTKKK